MQLEIEGDKSGSAYIHSHHNQLIYHVSVRYFQTVIVYSSFTIQIVIGVGPANASESETAVYYSNTLPSTAPTVFIGQPPRYISSAPPPSPYSVETIETCAKCGIVRQDLTAKFSSSCGGAFEKL
ncbi:unnamed protein product [Adineta ricciae]|uniref:Uncharacterized protein n=1 Tax=Adineta ricciae TaxID=249248 RepID=A0A814NFU0_ADIRI|nr:unnamed protein product [Adineta ricciae]